MKIVRNTIFFIFLSGSLLAQEDIQYFDSVAGDSAFILMNKALVKEDVGSFVTISLVPALYRIVFSDGLTIGDGVSIEIKNSSGQNVDFANHGNSIDIKINGWDNYRFKVIATQSIQNGVIGRFYWVFDNRIRIKPPNFVIHDIHGKEYSSDGLRGKIVVLNFWGISCKPCRKELPNLNKLVDGYANRKDVVFLALSDDPNDELKSFQEEVDFNYTLVHKENSLDFCLDMMGGDLYALPSHIIMDKKGDVVFYYLGEHPDIENILGFCIDKQK